MRYASKLKFSITSLVHLLAYLLVAAQFCVLLAMGGDLCTSVDELTRLASVKQKISDIIQEQIHDQEEKLVKLYDLHRALRRKSLPTSDHSEHLTRRQWKSRHTDQYDHHHLVEHELEKPTVDHREFDPIPSDGMIMAHPVGAFVSLNRMVKVMDELDSLVHIHDDKPEQLELDLTQLREKHIIPSSDDLYECGKALLRLQAFYDISIDNLISGRLLSNSKNNVPSGFGLDFSDCLELGKVAYGEEDYPLAILWFERALELLGGEQELLLQRQPLRTEKSILTNELLDYLAYAAYKDGQVRYATRLTKLWLAREPDNERARENLEYYELGEVESEGTESSATSSSNNEETITESSIDLNLDDSSDSVSASKSMGVDNKESQEFKHENFANEVIRNLCRQTSVRVSRNSCTRKLTIMRNHAPPDIKMETLHSSPNIMRIHDLVSNEEARHLRQLALPRLKRSTIQTVSGGARESDTRIAKTAWLSNKSDPIVDRIEKRISAILNLDLADSEQLQVVNYGLGGFFGPHLDTPEVYSNTNRSDSINTLVSNNRLATVLIYLSGVEAGGSTVFPRLGLAVRPLEKSAVIWYNIMRNGLTDDKTLHTGCPVLLGSKWIATKWPRERSNSFLRPCGLKPEDD